MKVKEQYKKIIMKTSKSIGCDVRYFICNVMAMLYKECDKEANILGKIVRVTVDRPFGSYHPEHRDMYYPINYGYIEGIMAPDGEEQDAYIIGINKAVKGFTGKVIPIVHRLDDVEEK